MRGDGGVAGEGRVVGVPKFHSWGKCTMPLSNINSDWMPHASSGHRLITRTGIGNEFFTHHHPCNASGFVTHAHKKSFTVHYTIALTVHILKYAYTFTTCSQSADYTCKMFTCDNYTCCQCVTSDLYPLVDCTACLL